MLIASTRLICAVNSSKLLQLFSFSMSNQSRNRKRRRPIDFASYPRRRIALMVSYLGWDYSGLVLQSTTEKTIEEYLFKALEGSRLCENRSKLEAVKAGRTDKGVSAFRQIICVTVRSGLKEGDGVFWPEGTQLDIHKNYSTEEIEFCQVINSHLPRDIRVLAWAQQPNEFSARFDCTRRTYKYFMPIADLDVERLRRAAAKLIGTHNFRNFCRIDAKQERLEKRYDRDLYEVSIENCRSNCSHSPYEMLEFTFVGRGFLWNQIRCFITILIEIGNKNESEEIIDELLDVEKNPCRPEYSPAFANPLILFDCIYGEHNLEWHYEKDAMGRTIKKLQTFWVDYQARASMVERMLLELQNVMGEEFSHQGLSESVRGGSPFVKKYIPLMERGKCDSLEMKKEKVEAKKVQLAENFI